LLYAAGNYTGAETAYQKAMDLAGHRGALGDMLRPAVELARMKYKSGKSEAASKLLGGVYRQFTDGFETPNMQEARELLEVIAADLTRSTSHT
jgi:predicted ATPase